MTGQQTMRSFLLVGALLSLLFVYSLVLDVDGRRILLSEGGLVESATALLYLACAAFMVYRGKPAYIKRHADLFLVIVFFLLRELDYDKKFTTIGLLKGRFFLSDSVPMTEKAIGAAIVLLLGVVALSILYRYTKDFWFGLKSRSIVSIGAMLALALLGTSQLLDGLSRKLKTLGLGIDKARETFVHALAAEEILELGIPVILLLTFSAHFRRSAHEALGDREPDLASVRITNTKR